jgi:hypothetical protein
MKFYTLTCDQCHKKIADFRGKAEDKVNIHTANMVISISIKGDLCIECGNKELRTALKGKALEDGLFGINDHRVPLR